MEIAHPHTAPTGVERALRLAALAAFAAALALAPLSSAGATSATVTVSAGSLGFAGAVPTVAFSATLTGLDQTASTTQAIDVGDATGSGSGWNVTGTSTTFSAGGGHTLPSSATTITSSPSVACDAGATCTTATTTGAVSYPYTLPAAGSAPTATKMFNAATNSGLGNQTVTPTWKVAIPANAYAGTYNSTWTLSLASGP